MLEPPWGAGLAAAGRSEAAPPPQRACGHARVWLYAVDPAAPSASDMPNRPLVIGAASGGVEGNPRPPGEGSRNPGIGAASSYSPKHGSRAAGRLDRQVLADRDGRCRDTAVRPRRQSGPRRRTRQTRRAPRASRTGRSGSPGRGLPPSRSRPATTQRAGRQGSPSRRS
ncbi:hypothetical protein ACRAWF_38370 [Streptomyces sp. L7]